MISALRGTTFSVHVKGKDHAGRCELIRVELVKLRIKARAEGAEQGAEGGGRRLKS